MKRFVVPVLAALLFVALVTAPALAEPAAAPAAAPAAVPAGTASPRNWEKLTNSSDELQESAVKADSAILMDEKTGDDKIGTVLFQKDADKRQYPASITKIMTCLLALEYVRDGHSMTELVTVGKIPKMQADATNIDLKEGETIRFEDLLYGLMIKSGNDAAVAIAQHVAGSLQGFVDMMNSKAADLGMAGTHYMNPHGLHDPNHYTTARDMAVLTRYALREFPDDFLDLVSKSSYTAEATNKHPKRTWTGHNLLISNDSPYGYIYAKGVKTGFTDEAQHTYVSLARKDSMSLISVVLHDGKNDKWTDSVTMFEYGFRYYDTLDLKSVLMDTPVEPLTVKNAAGSDPGMGKLQMLLRPKPSVGYITDRKTVIEALRNDLTQIVPHPNITNDKAPIAQSDVLGTMTFTYNEQAVMEYDLIAARDVKEMPTPAPTPTVEASGNASSAAGPTNQAASPSETSNPDTDKAGTGSPLVWAGLVILALLFAVVAIRLVNVRRRNRKFSQYNYRQGGGARMRR